MHTLEMLMIGKNFTLHMDGGRGRTIMNEGDHTFMDMKEPMYVGGISDALQETAFKKWHLRSARSFRGW